MVELDGGILVTPWHPVKPSGTNGWKFPVDLAPVNIYNCDMVYSFVLEGGEGAMQIGLYDAVTLGHGIEDDPVAKHEYLGSDKVIQDLSKMVGWQEGKVELDADPAIRDCETGLIIGFRQIGQERD